MEGSSPRNWWLIRCGNGAGPCILSSSLLHQHGLLARKDQYENPNLVVRETPPALKKKNKQKKKQTNLCVLGIKEKVICVFGENRLCQGCRSGQSNLVPRPRTGFLPNPHSTGAALPRPWASAAGMPASPLSVLPVCTAKVPSLHSIPVPMGECC